MGNSRRITEEECKLIEFVEKCVDQKWDELTSWEKSFIEDIIGKYHQYKSNMYLSSKQIDYILQVSEKVT